MFNDITHCNTLTVYEVKSFRLLVSEVCSDNVLKHYRKINEILKKLLFELYSLNINNKINQKALSIGICIPENFRQAKNLSLFNKSLIDF